MRISVPLHQLTSSAMQFIRKDKIILVPYLIFSLIFTSINSSFLGHSTQGKRMLLIIGFSIITELLIKFWLISMTAELKVGTQINIKKTIQILISKLKPLLINAILFLPAIGFLLFQMNQWAINISKGQLTMAFNDAGLLLLVLITIVVLNLIFEFTPMMIILKNENGIGSIYKTIILSFKNLPRIMVFFTFAILVRIFFVGLTLLFWDTSTNISLVLMFLRAIIQGFGNTFIFVIEILFFFYLTDPPPQIDIQV